jgi:hypothetical protein
MRKSIDKISFDRISLIIIGLLSILGGAAVTYSTANGPWGYSDPVAYIVAARNLLKGIGLGYYYPSGRFYVLTHYPPFYPLVLAGIGIFRVDLVDAARWLSVVFFAATIFSAGLIFVRYSSSSTLAVPASVLMGIFPVMVTMFSSSMSEPLFVFLLLWSGFCLVGYLKHDNLLWLVLSAILTGLLPLTRYIGIAVIFAGVVSIFLFIPGVWKERLKKAALFGSISVMPIVLWVFWVYFSVDHTLAGRGMQFDWGGLSGTFRDFRGIFLETVWKWIPFVTSNLGLTSRLRFILIMLTIIIVSSVAWLADRRVRKSMPQAGINSDFHILGVFGLSSLAYVVVLALTYLFTKPAPDIDDRILLPLYPGIVMSLLGAFACWQNAWFRNGRPWLKIIPWLIAAVCVYWYYPTSSWAVNHYHRGQGIAIYSWRDSETMKALRDLPGDVPIVSNNAAAILLWADHPAYELMEDINPAFIDQTTPYGSDMSDNSQVAFREHGAALVIFREQFLSQIGGTFGEKGLTRLNTIFTGLALCGQYADGTIYFYPK